MPLTVDFETASVEELVGLFEHESPYVRADAACALGDRMRARELDSLPERVHSSLRLMLEDREVLPRIEAAITLAELHDNTATGVLVSAMRSRTFRLDATRALGVLGDLRAAPELKRTLNRWLMPWADKMQAAAALCSLGDSIGMSYLEGKLASERDAERAAAIHFFGEFRHPRAFDLLSRILADRKDRHRDVAARALGLLGDSRARDLLIAARTTAEPELVIDIDEALAALSKHGLG